MTAKVKASKGSFKLDCTIDLGENFIHKANYINPFYANISLLHPWKRQKILVFRRFQGVQKWKMKFIRVHCSHLEINQINNSTPTKINNSKPYLILCSTSFKHSNLKHFNQLTLNSFFDKSETVATVFLNIFLILFKIMSLNSCEKSFKVICYTIFI